MRVVHAASPCDSMFALVSPLSLFCSYADVRRAHTAWNLHCVRMHCSAGDRACVCVCLYGKISTSLRWSCFPEEQHHLSKMITIPRRAQNTQTHCHHTITPPITTPQLHLTHTHTCYSDHCSFNTKICLLQFCSHTLLSFSPCPFMNRKSIWTIFICIPCHFAIICLKVSIIPWIHFVSVLSIFLPLTNWSRAQVIGYVWNAIPSFII